MRFQTPLIPAVLLRRHKRFLADARLMDGREVTVHCPNPGSMLGMATPDSRIWLEPNDDPKKKLKFGWRLLEAPNGAFVGVDTSLPNRIVRQALTNGEISELADYATIRPEVKYGNGSRVDFLLSDNGKPDLYLEVKSVTLSRRSGHAEFPDSVTSRGAKHLQELTAMVDQGHRAMLFYLVQRTDARAVSVASDIDPTYAHLFNQAMQAGVEVLCYACDISPDHVTLAQRLPFEP